MPFLLVNQVAGKEFVDEIWIIPVYQHVFPTKQNLLWFDKRKYMLDLVYQNMKCNNCIIRVLSIEKVVHSVINTDIGHTYNQKTIGNIDVIRLLYEYYGIPTPIGNNNDTQFYLLMGLDTCMDLLNNKWKSSLLLLQHIKILLVNRFNNMDISSCQFYPEFSHRITQLDIRPPDISSTYIREYKPTSTMINMYAISPFLASLVPCELVTNGSLHPLIYKYITTNGLYFYEKEEVKCLVTSRKSIYLGITTITVQVIVGMFLYYSK